MYQAVSFLPRCGGWRGRNGVSAGALIFSVFVLWHAGLLHSLVRCDLETGHRHQIRAHLAYLGTPIANDTDYGGTTPAAGKLRRILSDDTRGTLERALTHASVWREWCPKCIWARDALRREASGKLSEPMPLVGQSIWLHALRYSFPTLGITINAPEPDFMQGCPPGCVF